MGQILEPSLVILGRKLAGRVDGAGKFEDVIRFKAPALPPPSFPVSEARVTYYDETKTFRLPAAQSRWRPGSSDPPSACVAWSGDVCIRCGDRLVRRVTNSAMRNGMGDTVPDHRGRRRVADDGRLAEGLAALVRLACRGSGCGVVDNVRPRRSVATCAW